MFWQGGFLFYSAVVVPVARSRPETKEVQPLVTRDVTRYLNFVGVFAIVVLGWDALATTDPSRRRQGLRVVSCVVLAVALGALFWLHPKLSELMDGGGQTIKPGSTLYPLHRVYLLFSTLQWFICLTSVWLMLSAWRVEDCEK
jgi:hypothetical protein